MNSRPYMSIKYEIEPLLYGEARIIETDGVEIFRQWWFRSTRIAMIEYHKWNNKHLQNEPKNYYRKIV